MGDRLSRPQINIMRSLAQRGADTRAITLSAKLRSLVIPLWRRSIVEIWYRQSPGEGLQGPYYALTLSGARLAQALFPAPRGISGAEQSP